MGLIVFDGHKHNSFSPETLVHAQDSEGKAVLTPISQLKIGDKVLAKSEWKPEEESLSYEPITDIISTPDSVQKWVHLTLADGKTIDATEGHPFNTPEGWRDAVLLEKGDILILTGSDGKPSTIQVDGIRYETKVLTTYNLEVANAHTFFVGEDAVLVHNSSCNPIWTSTKKRSPVKNAYEHWKKHEDEFPEYINSKQYVDGTKNFLNNPPSGTLTKTRANGDTVAYHPPTNTFGIKDANGTPRTMFRPTDGIKYYHAQ